MKWSNRPDAVMFVLAQRVWQAGSGLVTIVLVSICLTAEQQGWNYSILSLASLYTLFELGLSIVLVQATAHLFVDLSWGPNGVVEGGAAARLESLLAWSLRYYSCLALGFVLIVAPGGYYFFSGESTSLAWQGPWILLAIAVALGLLPLPFQAIVEGSGEITEVYAVRLLQGVAGNISCWLLLLAGAGLWAVVAPAVATVLVQGLWLATRKWELVRLTVRMHPAVDWRHDIWPHHWRLSVAWLSGYLTSQLYIPILFKMQGAVVAGQMGLSLTAANMLALVSQSWVVRDAPQMSRAVVLRDWSLLDALFSRDVLLSCVTFGCGAIALCVLRWVFEGTSIAERFFSIWPLACLLLMIILVHIQQLLAAQLRSFRKEPLTWVFLVAAVLTVAGSVPSAKRFGASGVIVAALLVQAISLPVSIFVWKRSNRRWRGALDREAAPSDDRDSDMESLRIFAADA
jgi:O-antigen/teichoic acid export membrane protein